MEAVLLIHKKLQGMKDLDGLKSSVSSLPEMDHAYEMLLWGIDLQPPALSLRMSL